MNKSVATTVVTAMFVLYSFYQRTVGVEATVATAPTPGSTNIAIGSSPNPNGGGVATPVPSSPALAQSNRTRPAAGNAAVSVPTTTPTQNSSGSTYKDGTYTGKVADAFYGNLQVRVTISNGKVTDVQFPEWPNDRSRSVRINQQALPMLVQEAIQAQSGRVNVISGATDTSVAFNQSLQSALSQAAS